MSPNNASAIAKRANVIMVIMIILLPLFEPGISRRPWEQYAERKALADVMAITQ